MFTENLTRFNFEQPENEEWGGNFPNRNIKGLMGQNTNTI